MHPKYLCYQTNKLNAGGEVGEKRGRGLVSNGGGGGQERKVGQSIYAQS